MTRVPDTLGQRVARRRAELKLTQRQLADRVGCDPMTVSAIECGRTTNVSLRLLDTLSVALDVSIDWLAKGAKPRERAS